MITKPPGCIQNQSTNSESSTRLYEKALEDAEFLRKLIMKRDSEGKKKEWVSPFSSEGDRDYAWYRQHYLRMYNPLQKRRKESAKEKTKKWLMKLKPRTHNLVTQSKDDNSSSMGSGTVVNSFLRLFRRRRSTNIEKVHLGGKKSAVTPIPSGITSASVKP